MPAANRLTEVLRIQEKAYREELANFAELGDEGEVWFGREVLDTVVKWTGDLLRRIYGEALTKTETPTASGSAESNHCS